MESYGSSYSYEASFGIASILVLIVGYLILMVVAAAIQSAFLGGLLDIANGQPVTIGSFFKPRNVGSVIIASLLIGTVGGNPFVLLHRWNRGVAVHALRHRDHRRSQYASH